MATAAVDGLLAKIHDTLLFQVDWPEQFSAVPRSISAMADCFIAINPSIRQFSLADSPISDFDIEYITLISSVVRITDKGTDGFKVVQERMATLYQSTGNIYSTLEEIVTACRNPIDKPTLQRTMVQFRTMAKESLKHCEEARKELQQWDGMIKELRGNVLREQGGTQRPPPAPEPAPELPPPPYPEPEPVVSTLPFPNHSLTYAGYRPPLTHAYWVLAPSVEACLRRFYKALTAAGSSPDWELLESPAGVVYLDTLLRAFEANEPHLVSYASHHYLNVLKGLFSPIVTNLRTIIRHGRDARTLNTAPMRDSTLSAWGYVRQLAQSALFHPSLSTWTRADLMDNLYYRQPLAPPQPPAPPAYDADALVKCTVALAKVSSEVQWVLHFFDAMVTTATILVERHTVNLKAHAARLVGTDIAEGQVETERGKFIKETQAIMAYYAAFRAVANMYRRIHLKYIQTGVQILNGLSAATTDALRNARHRELRAYNVMLAKDLKEYIEGERKKIIAQVKSTIRTILLGIQAVAQDGTGAGWESE